MPRADQKLTAHEQAWERAEILHRDISIGNIIIDIDSLATKRPKGLLCDWDLSKSKDRIGRTTQTVRSGTWAFMSGPSLAYPLKPPEVSDDLESIVNLMYWNALRFHKRDLSDSKYWNADAKEVGYNDRLARFVWKFFLDDEKYQSTQGALWIGGETKFYRYSKPKLPFRLAKKDMFKLLLEDLHQLCYKHYRSLDEDELEKYLPPAQTEEPSPEASPSPEAGPLMERQLIRVTRSPPPSELVSDPLANHAQLKVVLSSFVENRQGWSANDKTPDQFENLPDMIVVPDKQESFMFGKRKTREDDDTQEQPNKIRRTQWSRS
ncbi:uncharacterized protein PHACADRAFT_204140 [Phanerochaete carnosa HHB-10118-sp]|uniref:Fungal-type protein kinase domain-containing protein n=1 Tax=Phanerochaete carnosa (strain HHB-10118-sp) TaxID=650164 RepID=K5XD92_PHACS|nr:uncharacterized protein PHACADRAFT_204140 [Phanerochaete carnosa HHB-10118-sp]EKM60992.1 hypothetical protein PHACADRAFT_204140 [Phanerochaete carnosa HHB-10118-sp]